MRARQCGPDTVGKDTAYCNAYVDNIYQYICHSNATVDSNQMVTSQSIKEVLQFSAKQTDTGSQSLIQFSANLATTGYATLGTTHLTVCRLYRLLIHNMCCNL